MRRFIFSLALLSAAPIATQAADVALVLGNETYRYLDRVSRADDVLNAASRLRAAGFDVFSLRNGDTANTGVALSGFAEGSIDAEAIVVILSGQFVTDGARTWFLTADARDPSFLGMDDTAVSVDSLLRILGQAPGHAVMLLGPEGISGPAIDPWLRGGLGDMQIPQGVTVIRGLPREIADFAENVLVVPGADIGAALRNQVALRAEGYLPHEHIALGVPAMPETDAGDTGASEDDLWQLATTLDTVDAYRAYLRDFPDGRYAAEAAKVIAEIEAEPNRAARKAEEALGLGREERREIQRDLSLLDYDTRGIDGIFGPGTRRAITNWQQVNGFSQTSYLTRDQINRLDGQAARRAAELEAEAERQRAEEARLDRAYWEETGAKGDEPGYRAYLEKFPDGLFAELAAQRLADIEAQKRAAAEAEDRAAWDAAVAADSVAAYNGYLVRFPDGVFRAEAEARIAALTADEVNADELEAAAEAERRLALNPITARLVEARLLQLGLNPGDVDGVFDDRTRRAIRRYQRARDLPVTGYLNEPTIVRLLADSIGVIGR